MGSPEKENHPSVLVETEVESVLAELKRSSGYGLVQELMAKEEMFLPREVDDISMSARRVGTLLGNEIDRGAMVVVVTADERVETISVGYTVQSGVELPTLVMQEDFVKLMEGNPNVARQSLMRGMLLLFGYYRKPATEGRKRGRDVNKAGMVRYYKELQGEYDQRQVVDIGL